MLKYHCLRRSRERRRPNIRPTKPIANPPRTSTPLIGRAVCPLSTVGSIMLTARTIKPARKATRPIPIRAKSNLFDCITESYRYIPCKSCLKLALIVYQTGPRTNLSTYVPKTRSKYQTSDESVSLGLDTLLRESPNYRDSFGPIASWLSS